MFLQCRSTDVQPQINGRSAIAMATIQPFALTNAPPRRSRDVAALQLAVNKP
jgi:hypothetical protein